MRFTEIAIRLTGISSPMFGNSWSPSEAEVTASKRIWLRCSQPNSKWIHLEAHRICLTGSRLLGPFWGAVASDDAPPCPT